MLNVTETYRITWVLMVISGIMCAFEYVSMNQKKNAFIQCKEMGRSVNNCHEQLGQKWRAERNNWMVCFVSVHSS